MRSDREKEALANDTLVPNTVVKNLDSTYAFKQQLLNAWKPKPTLKCAITVYLFIGLLFFALGIAVLVFTDKIHERVVRYDNVSACYPLGTTCALKFNIKETIPAPVHIYYEIDKFYQNHRRYILTIPFTQLRGNDLPASDLSNCGSVLYNKDIPATVAVDGTPLDPDDVAIPCGNAARAFFNDTFVLISAETALAYEISDEGIAWKSDIDHKFKNIDLSRQWRDIEDERFMTWMKIAPFSNFRKGWGVINNDIPAGDYNLMVTNNWDVQTFGGRKYFVISNANEFGGKNYFLAYSYIAFGSLSILLGILFIFRKLKRPKGILNKIFKETNFIS